MKILLFCVSISLVLYAPKGIFGYDNLDVQNAVEVPLKLNCVFGQSLHQYNLNINVPTEGMNLRKFVPYAVREANSEIDQKNLSINKCSVNKKRRYWLLWSFYKVKSGDSVEINSIKMK